MTRGITALLKKMDYRDVVVAVDGSLFRHHPHFHNVMKSRVAQVLLALPSLMVFLSCTCKITIKIPSS